MYVFNFVIIFILFTTTIPMCLPTKKFGLNRKFLFISIYPELLDDSEIPPLAMVKAFFSHETITECFISYAVSYNLH